MNTNSISWNSPLLELYPRQIPKAVNSLAAANYKTLYDLLWVLPLSCQKIPQLAPFDECKEGELFQGAGKVISFQSRPNYRSYGKNGVRLQNVVVTLKDFLSHKTMELRWFNAYPNLIYKVKKIDRVIFSGICKTFNGKWQVVNPQLTEASMEDITDQVNAPAGNPRYDIRYPTINGVNSAGIKRLMGKIPEYLWAQIEEHLSDDILRKNQFPSLGEAFGVLHGRLPYSPELFDAAKKRLVYEEFFQEQVKVFSRKQGRRSKEGIKLSLTSNLIGEAVSLFPYPLTPDQLRAIEEIALEMVSGHPMMKLLQGDVGCGKTTVAVAAAWMAHNGGHQTAFMCPTESLAIQHFSNICEILEGRGLTVELLLGSTSAKEKLQINKRLASGSIGLLIGTHALIQDNIQFHSLGLSIIDEQHKFGVNQRIRLTEKQEGCHCLIMTATPIPRSLCLTQYGDLSLSVIKTMPGNRKKIQTRIVTPSKMEAFFSFVYTRLEMGEQAYVVVPAIQESQVLDIANLEEVHERFERLFPDHSIAILHGKMKAEEKGAIFQDFKERRTHILIATSVIEVGINVINATIMAVFGPDRFGLSSLHQLRGRVGRGSRPGFFFLISEKGSGSLANKRMKILEETTDGFKISEEDLRIRGKGDLFGTEQSGSEGHRRLACIVEHRDILLNARLDVEQLMGEGNPHVLELASRYQESSSVTKTI